MARSHAPETHLTLELEGMTCAACANRIERSLNKLEGLEASVNFALERAEVRAAEGAAGLTEQDAERAVAAVEKAGYHARIAPDPRAAVAQREGEEQREQARDDAARSLARRLWICLALAVPVVALSMIPAIQFPGWQWLALALTLPVATWGAWPFHRASWLGIRHGGIRGMSMNTLISLGITAALAWSLWSLIFGHAGMLGMRHEMGFELDRTGAQGHLYLEVAASVTVFMLAGRLAEARAKRAAGRALKSLLTLAADRAELVQADGRTREIPAAELQPGDRFLVRPGTRIATDGVIVEGSSAIDTSMVTGESLPREVTAGDEVTGATLNTTGSLVIEATRVGDDTVLARMARMVDEAQSGKAAAQRLADRISSVFVPLVILLSLGTLAGWLMLGHPLAESIGPSVAVLIIACPCALGLATPMAILVGSGRGARMGILIRGPEALEHARDLHQIVLDKTGTLTSGEFEIHQASVVGTVSPIDHIDAVEAIRLAASVEAHSEHPIARALVAHAQQRGYTLSEASNFRSIPGEGVIATANGHTVRVGRVRSEAGLAELAELEAQGLTSIAVDVDGTERAVLSFGDRIRPVTKRTINALRELGIEPVLVSGDSAAAVGAVATELSIPQAHAEVRPEGKLRIIQELGPGTAMLGDGVNDAPALAASTLGIAMGGGTDAAMEAADITLVRDDLGAVVDAIRLSRAMRRTMIGNLVWAFGYNVAAIPLAALGYLSPTIAGAAMACSSLFVVLNSLRLNAFRTSTMND